MSGNQKQVKRSRKQTARTKRHALRWTAPLLGVYALGAPHGWADTLDATTLESNRTDLQRAILPTAPAGIMQDIVPVEPPKLVKIETNSLMEFEPSDDGKILNELLTKYFEYSMYYALVDSLAAEHSARMQAMDNATNNAKERVAQLKLSYNKARQESITTELIEIISGVESMK